MKIENYMKAKYPEPEQMIDCWRSKSQSVLSDLPDHKGTAWYRIADSHLSPTPESKHPHYWICACDKHKPYTKNPTLFGERVKAPAMIDYSKELDEI